MDIKVKNGGFFSINLFDKCDSFRFKVINYPRMIYSNIPTKPLYLSYICRICTEYAGFIHVVQNITQEFLNKAKSYKSFDKKNFLTKYFNKFVNMYELEWSKFGVYLIFLQC